MITRYRIVVTVLLGLALYGLIYAFTRPTDNQQPALVDQAVRHVEPSPGDRVLRQTDIAVDLDPSYVGILQIDRREIPDDQLDRIPGLNRVAFTPGEGKDIETFDAGRHCVTAVFWPVTQSRNESRNYTWCFETH